MQSFPFTTSFWFDPDSCVSPALEGTHTVDVAVVGGGFAGLSAARHLQQSKADLRIAVIEAKHIGYGASGRNAGWLMGLPPLIWLLDNLEDRERLDDIRWTARTCWDNIQELSTFIQQESIDCNWTPTHHTLVARSPIEVATLRWIAPRFEAVGLNCAYYDRGQAQQFAGYPTVAALTYDIVTIQPYKLAYGLRQYLQRQGVEVYENTPIKRIETTRQGVRLTTAGNASLIARKVILATNAYTHTIETNLEMPDTYLRHTYMLVTQPLSRDMLDRINPSRIPFGDPTLSFFIGRIHNDRLIFNGIDRASKTTMADDQHMPSFNALYAEMVRRFPFLDALPLASAWGGAVQQTTTDAPIVRVARNNPDVILNLGYGGGSGVGMALLSGKLITDLVLKDAVTTIDAQRLRRLYESSRFPLLGPVRAVAGVMKRLILG